MDIAVRQEKPEDYPVVFDLIEKAFENELMSDHEEQNLVERLRKSNSFIPELSLVALYGDKIVGHILLTRVKIVNAQYKFESLALAPVSVLPEYQNKGIGGMLIKNAHKAAKDLGYKSIVLLGHAGYYPKFGYKPASTFGVELPYNVPDENCLAIELVEEGLKGVSGIVEYPKEFNS